MVSLGLLLLCTVTGAAGCGRARPVPVRTVAGDDAISVAASPAGAPVPLTLVTTSDPGFTFVRSLARGRDLAAFVEDSEDTGTGDALRVVDLATGRVVLQKSGLGIAYAVALSTDDRLVAVTRLEPEGSGSRQTVTVWDVHSGATVLQAAAPDADGAVAFNPDATKIVMAGFRIQAIDIATGASHAIEIESPDGSLTNAGSVAFLPGDGGVVAAGPEYYVTWRPPEAAGRYQSCGCGAWSVATHSTGRVVFTTKSTVAVWRVDTGRVETSVHPGFLSTTATLAADGSRLMVLGLTEDRARTQAVTVRSGDPEGRLVAVRFADADAVRTTDGEALAPSPALWGADGVLLLVRDGARGGVRLERALVPPS